MKKLKLLFFSLLGSAFFNAQIGIGSEIVNPHASAILDIQSSTKGMLAPRMTTAQRMAISSPAESLLVYDTTIKAFYNYTGSSWVELGTTGLAKRTNYKLIKSVADLAPELVAGKYVLKSNTLYEINGTITLDHPIELNNAYIQGIDSGDDQLVATGNIFDGSTGGSIKGLTLVSTDGKIFNLKGANTENLIFRDCIVANSNSVGSISGLGMVFISIVQFSGNTTGIEYKNINQLLISNVGWFGNNSGTFEKLTGTFGLVQKQGGFSDLTAGTFGLDVGTNPVITGSAVLEGVVFTGNTTGTKYVNKYTEGSYSGYNFNNSWTVDSPGIPREGDAEATGDINLSTEVGSGALTTFSTTGAGSRKKLVGTTTSNSLFRFTNDGNNKITYRGNKSRYFQVVGSMSYQGNANLTLILYIAKNGVVQTETKVYGRPSAAFFGTNAGILALPIVGTIQLKKDDYIEVWAERFDGGGDISTVSLNLTAR